MADLGPREWHIALHLDTSEAEAALERLKQRLDEVISRAEKAHPLLEQLKKAQGSDG